MGDRIRIALLRVTWASPEEIRAWSAGEVTEPETIDYRSFEPVPDGLFCERIFAPLKGWQCGCGAARAAPLWIVTDPRSSGIVCPTCGVESPRSRLYCDRMGHVELAAPVRHPWSLEGAPDSFAPEILPVLPPDLRPMKRLDSRRFAISHLNDLYRRVINRNNRLKKIMAVNAPEKIIQREKQMLQQAVEALIDNGRLPDPVRDKESRPLWSLSDTLAAKVRELRDREPRDASLQLPAVRSDAALAGVPRYAEILGGEALPVPGTPKSAWALIHRLRALGLKVVLADATGQEIRPEALEQDSGAPIRNEPSP